MSTRFFLFFALTFLALHSVASSQNWVLLPSPDRPLPDLRAVLAHSDNDLLVAGVRAGIGHLYSSGDRGNTWRELLLPGSPSGLLALGVAQSNDSLIVVAGEGGYVAISVDAGSTWSERSIPTAVWPAGGDIRDVLVRDANCMSVVGMAQSGSGPRIAITADGGSTWRNITLTGKPNNLHAIVAIDSLRAIAVGSGTPPRRSRTFDRGASWEADARMRLLSPVPSGSLVYRGLKRADGSGDLWSGGGRTFAWPQFADIRYSRDGGSTWLSAGPGTVASAPALDIISDGPRFLFVPIAGGSILRSRDAGTTWVSDTLPLSVAQHDLHAIDRSASGVSYVVGDGGTLLRFNGRPLNEFFDVPDNSIVLCRNQQRKLILRIANNGTARSTLTGVTISGNGGGVTCTPQSSPTILYPATDDSLTITATVGAEAIEGRYSRRVTLSFSDGSQKSIDMDILVVCASLTVSGSGQRDAGRIRIDPNIAASLMLPGIVTAQGTCPVEITDVRMAIGTDFTVIAPTPPVVLNPTQSLQVILEFQPKQTCERYDTLLIFHDAVSTVSPIRIPVMGVGLVPSISITPQDTLDFGGVLIGQQRSDTIGLHNTQSGLCLDTTRVDTLRIIGPNRTDFASGIIIRRGTRIAPMATLQVPITASPSAAGRRIAYALVKHELSGNASDTVVLLVNGLQAELTTLKNDVAFAATDLGGRRDSVLREFLQNLGTAPVSVSDIFITGIHPSDFVYTGPLPPFNLTVGPGPGFKSDLGVAFVPTTTGLRQATLRIVTSAGDREIALRGNADYSSGDIQLRELIFTPATTVNTCADTTIERLIVNTGVVPLRILSGYVAALPGSPGADDSAAFSIVSPVIPPDYVILPGDSGRFTIRFCPKRPGPHQARLVLLSNREIDTISATLTGIGRAVQLVSTDSIVFAPTRTMRLRDSVVQNLINNAGAGSVMVDSMSITGADAGSYTVLGPSTPYTIAAGGVGSVSIRFLPLRRGRHFAFLNIYTTQGRSTVTLLGESIFPFLDIRPESQAGLRVRLGTSRRVTINIINAGDDTSRIESAAISGSPAFSNAGIISLPTLIAPGDTLALKVDFAPLVLCEHDAVVQIRAEGVSGVYRIADTNVAVVGLGVLPLIGARSPVLNFGGRVPGIYDSVTTDFIGNMDFGGRAGDCADSTVIDSIVIVGRDASAFTILAPSDPLSARAMPAGALLPLTIRFAPSGSGARRAELRIYFDGSPDSISTVTLVGTVVSLPIRYGPAPSMIEIDFGRLRLGWQRDSLFTVTNISANALRIDELTTGGVQDFIILSPTSAFTLQPGVPTEVRVRFAPVGGFGDVITFIRLRSGIVIDSSFGLRGSAVGSAFRIAPDTLDFGLRTPGAYDSLALLDNRATLSVPLPFVDSVVIDRAVILSGAPFFEIISLPSGVSPGRKDSLVVRFNSAGFFQKLHGILRIYYDHRIVDGVSFLDSADVQLVGTVDGDIIRASIDLGPDINGAPGDIVGVPLTIGGDIAQAAADTLEITLSYRKTILRPLSLTSAQVASGVTATIEEIPSPTPLDRHARLRIVAPAGLPFVAGLIGTLNVEVLLGDALESDFAVTNATVPSRPEVIIVGDTIGFTINEFCDAQGRLIRFDSSLGFVTRPNPIRDGHAVLDYIIPAAVHVTIVVYDPLGNEVIRAVDEQSQPGHYAIELNLVGLPSGIYRCQLQAGRFTRTLTLQILE